MKKVLGVFFGGISPEHEVSITSARGISAAVDRRHFHVILIYIDRKGIWHECDENLHPVKSYTKFEACSKILPKIDIAFPIMHGPYGEDGSFQGFLEVFGIPYVGAGVLGSAISMDKDVMKRLLKNARLPIVNFITATKPITFEEATQKLRLPMFVKPANLGSSVGIEKIEGKGDFNKFVENAFCYDTKIILEEAVEGVREFECSVLEKAGEKKVSLPGEIILGGHVYSYQAKYLDDSIAQFALPADLPKEEILQIQALSLAAFEVLGLESMARIDFLRDKDGQYFIGESNSIPGFTPISLYPKLWEISGINYNDLVRELIDSAFERFEKRSKLKKDACFARKKHDLGPVVN